MFAARRLSAFTGWLLLAVCAGCATSAPRPAAPEASAPSALRQPAGDGWPLALPADRLLPGETLSPEGFAQQQQRSASATPGTLVLQHGKDWFAASGVISATGEVASLDSGPAGGAGLSAAIYRIPLAGQQPGLLSLDINLKPRSDASPSSYYVGLSDYAGGNWQWCGPYSAPFLRLGRSGYGLSGNGLLSSANYLSPLGNLLVAVVAHGGASLDIVDVAAAPLDLADATAPATPSGFSALPAVGAVQFLWTQQSEPDVIGYRLYTSAALFSAPTGAGVAAEPLLVDYRTMLRLAASTDDYFAALTAVDGGGNESALSLLAQAQPLPGAAPQATSLLNPASGELNFVSALELAGASSFEVDFGADGSSEIPGAGSGSVPMDTSQSGIRRAHVAASGPGADDLAFCGASALVLPNLPPTAAFTISPDGSANPGDQLDLDASASGDPDGEIVAWDWEFSGDGLYDEFSGETTQQIFLNPGPLSIGLRVTDNHGATAETSQQYTLHGWVRITIDTEEDAGEDNSLDIIAGHPAVSYIYNPPGGGNSVVRYARSSTPEGADPADWVVVSLPVPDTISQFTSLEAVNGVPAVCFATFGGIAYAHSSSPEGTLASDWSAAIIDGRGASAYTVCLREVDGRPAAIFPVFDGLTGELVYSYSESADGAQPDDWHALSIFTQAGGVGYANSFQLVGGNPAVSFYSSTDGLRYGHSSTAGGQSLDDWGFQLVDAAAVGTSSSLQVIAGRPAVAYQGAGSSLSYARAGNSTGLGAAWVSVELEADGNSSGWWAGLVEFNGLPVATCYRDDGTPGPRVAFSSSADGLLPTDWSLDEIYPNSIDTRQSAAVINGRLCISLYNETHTGLDYATLY